MSAVSATSAAAAAPSSIWGGLDGPADRADILIVDDLPEKLLVFETVLGDLNQNLVFARSGADALRQILRRDFAVILLDVNMPDMDGFETATLIRRYKRAAHTPIIFITSYADEMQTARGYSLGAVDYIPSPVVPEVLRSKIRVFVELHILQRRIARQAEERVALAASEAALRLAEESTRRSSLLAGLSHALSGVLDLRQGIHALLTHVVPALAANATVALVDERGVVTHAATRSSLFEDDAASVELSPSALPSAHFALLREALEAPADAPARTANFVDGALQMLPLIHGDRFIGGLWIDGELTALSAALLDEVAARAAIAFATASLYGALQVEIAERRQAEARLEEASRRKDEFLAMLAHELRNPLAPIRNAVELIRLAAPAEAKVRWAADVTDRQVRQLTRLVDELLDVARISQGKVVLQTQCLDLVTLVTQAIDSQRDMLHKRHQTLTLSLPDKPVNLNGDATRLAQVVNNLLSNAIKYTPEGGAISVSVAHEPGGPGEFALLEVSDNGIGIDADLLPHVFELFEQGKRALDRTQGGLGVGLTLVQRLVQLHGGEVVATSAGAGQGSQFRVLLPCLGDVEEPVAPERSEQLPAATVARRILVVDDNVDVVETTTMLLSLSGHQVRSAKDGLQALHIATEFRPDVVLLDIGLPLMDGYEVARRLRQTPQTAGALLIALTGYGQQGDRQRGRDAGFDGHMLKPVDPHALAKMIEG
ncbi:response regulator [Scleromatobacter humisilvae]|uniref:histidine kinase n=1 Tax=Scleromatobacter humisilvae TaxID=2897159 RepID=A0A9X2BZB7_9BURK|nr:response regulator [Scleromatobacter humisilvae]MCK9686147.1 response regulator [Scleromatobacter humisilvae]